VIDLPNEEMSPLFEAVTEATEEAVINSLFAATSMDGDKGHHIDPLPVNKVVKLYRQARGQ
jgi:D-aminopeptidase